MDDLVTDFVAETLESLALLDQALVRFEQAPKDEDILSNIFRMMHTIKGTCGFLGLPRLEKVAHAGEDILGRFRDGDLDPTPESVTAVMKSIDRIRAIVEHLAEHGVEGEDDDAALIAELKAVVGGQAVAAPVPEAEAGSGPAFAPEGFPVAAELLAEVGELASPPQSEPQPQPQATSASSAAKPEVAKAEAPKEKQAAQTIRVSVDVLENLMTLVSEMVLTRNQLLQLTRLSDNSVFKEPIEHLSRTTSELQEGVMKTRMQPIGSAWGKLPRIVRDLANELGKKINLSMHGEETELDRQVLELIQDPLTHMVRNSADHGLEQPEERRAAGKNAVGTIRLSAFHEGGHIIIQIADDGRGINTAKIRAKIVERGLADADQVAAMDDHTVNQYIMRAGFSTAEKVTKVSGRGVGMDVVRSNIEKIGGSIEFRSTHGQGSAFTIKIPLTLAIISSLIVKCGDERFALPQIAVNEVVRISERSEHKIDSLKGSPILRLRDRLLPLVNLSECLGLENAAQWSPGQNRFEGYVVVCRNGSQVLGVIVDSISDAEEIVVKPLSKVLGNTKYFSGNTVLGDGRVILILDMNGLASGLSQDTSQSQDVDAAVEEHRTPTESILLFRTATRGLRAVQLASVQRIEHLDMATTETVQGDVVVQYRGRLLPLMSLDGPGGVRREGSQQVLVFGEDETAVGLVIESVVDIVQDTINVLKPSRMPGVAGSAIVAGKAVDILDPQFLVGQVVKLSVVSNFGEAA